MKLNLKWNTLQCYEMILKYQTRDPRTTREFYWSASGPISEDQLFSPWIPLSDELNQITESLDFQKFVATFHLKIIHKVLVDHYNFQKGGHVKSSFSNKRPVELFDSRKGNIPVNIVMSL